MKKADVKFGPPESEVRELIRSKRTSVIEGGQKPGQPHIRHQFHDPSPYERMILGGLQMQAHIYGGTVPAGVIADRRAKNRVARKSRRINRIARQR